MNEEDKRVIRTRSQLAMALIELSCEEGYEAVTIQNITDRAGINYRTFYRHYNSKDDLLHEVLRNTMTGLRSVMQPPTPADLNDPNFKEISREKGRILYEFVAGHSKIFRVFIQSGPAALIPMLDLAMDQSKSYMKDLPLGGVPYDLVATHMVTSSFSFIRWWLDSDMAYTPEQMGAYVSQLVMLPIRQLLVEDGRTELPLQFPQDQ